MTRAQREIGGYLELERYSGKPYHCGAVELNCGRSCLEYLIELRGVRTIWLPDWLCASVFETCVRLGVDVRVYAVGADMRPKYDFEIGSGDYLYLVDYYGQLTEFDVAQAAACCEGRLVVDEAQGFFRTPWDCADTLYTCRKFFGVADGAYLYTKDGTRLGRELTRDESYLHMGFVLGRFECSASGFLKESRANNARFAGGPAMTMSLLTENLLRAVDYVRAKRRREENWNLLHEDLGELNRLSLSAPEGPFMYPLFVGDSRRMRERLARRGLFVPTLWPNVADGARAGATARLYSESILPLPIDQRYSAEDMKYELEVLRECLF